MTTDLDALARRYVDDLPIGHPPDLTARVSQLRRHRQRRTLLAGIAALCLVVAGVAVVIAAADRDTVVRATDTDDTSVAFSSDPIVAQLVVDSLPEGWSAVPTSASLIDQQGSAIAALGYELTNAELTAVLHILPGTHDASDGEPLELERDGEIVVATMVDDDGHRRVSWDEPALRVAISIEGTLDLDALVELAATVQITEALLVGGPRPESLQIRGLDRVLAEGEVNGMSWRLLVDRAGSTLAAELDGTVVDASTWDDESIESLSRAAQLTLTSADGAGIALVTADAALGRAELLTDGSWHQAVTTSTPDGRLLLVPVPVTSAGPVAVRLGEGTGTVTLQIPAPASEGWATAQLGMVRADP